MCAMKNSLWLMNIIPVFDSCLKVILQDFDLSKVPLVFFSDSFLLNMQ